MAVGDISYYVLKPWIKRDEFFHRTIAEFVTEWARSEPSNLREVVVVAAEHTGRAYAVRDLLSRNGIPACLRARASDLGQRVLARTGQPEGDIVIWMPAIGGTCLVDPTDAEIPRGLGYSDGVARDRSGLRPARGGSRASGARHCRLCRFRGGPHLVVEREAIGGKPGPVH